MSNTINYVTKFESTLRELYGQELTSDLLFQSNSDIQVVNTKYVKIPTLSVSGYKDHSRSSMSFNAGSYNNNFEQKTLAHDRDVEFAVDPMDIDETATVLSLGNIQNRFERTQAIPELDCYTYSKLYSEATRLSMTIKTTTLTSANVLADFDANIEALEDAGVSLDRVVLFCTAAYKKLLNTAEDVQRTLDVKSGGGVDRRVRTLDDIQNIVTVPSARFKSSYDFTDGCVAASGAKQMQYILIDPECQVSRVKYSYIHLFAPGSDSRTADKYLYQNRRLNDTFAIDHLFTQGCIIHANA